MVRDFLRRGYLIFRKWVPLTPLGFWILLLSGLVFTQYALPREDYVIQLFSASALALVLIGVLAVLLELYGLHRQLEALADSADTEHLLRFEAQRGFGRGSRYPRLLLPWVDVSVFIDAPAGLEVFKDRGRERVEGRFRAGAAKVTRRYVIDDAFGLAQMSLTHELSQTVSVSPWLGGLEHSPHLMALAPGDSQAHPRGRPNGDRVELRPYVRGDPLRLVLWKIYARTGEMMVRTSETARDEDSDVHAYLICGPGDEPAAAVAWISVTKQLLGPSWRFGTDSTPEGTTHISAAEEAIMSSRAMYESPSPLEDALPTGNGQGLRTFLAGITSDAGARVMLFAPCRLGPWIDQVLRECARFRGRTTVVIGFDTLDAVPEKTWLLESESASDRLEGTDVEQLQTIVRSLGALDAEVLLFDRKTGRGRNGYMERLKGVA